MSRSLKSKFSLRGTRALALLALPGAAFLLGGSIAHGQFCSATDRVLWVGDSWSEIMWDQRILGDALDQFGQDDKNEYNDDPTGGIDPNQTAISGMTAAAAADPGQFNYPLRIQNVLTAKPEIDIVLISLGGNDMIAGGWFIQGPAFYTSANLDAIAANINTIVQASLAVRPDVEVVIFGYDYVGLWEYAVRNPLTFEGALWASWGVQPDTFYQCLVDMETRKKAIADGNPRVWYINNLGTMQNVQGHALLSVPAGVVPRPTASNFPQGYVDTLFGFGRVGNDQAAWRGGTDWIHLTDPAYKELCINTMVQYFFPKFRGTPTATFFSDGGLSDGYTIGIAGVGTGNSTTELRMGDVGGTQTYRSILSFDTSLIPDSATVTAASLYFCRSGIGGVLPVNPFTGSQGNPILDIRTGTFGNAFLENSDYQAAADANNVGCFAGSAKNNNYFVRVDVQSGGLGAINRTGTTQFKFYFPSTDPGDDYIRFYDGDAGAVLEPFLDVTYSLGGTASPTPSPTASPTSSPSASASTSTTPSPSPTPSGSPSPMPSSSPTETPTSSPSSSASPTPSPTPTGSPSPTPNAVSAWEIYG